MKEESVFWLGAKPGTKAAASQPPAATSLQPAVFAACRTAGLEPEDFVAALGEHGSWLVSFTREARPERFVWNARQRQLVLQGRIRSGGWEDLNSCPVESPNADGFAAGIRWLASGKPGPPA